MAKFVVTLRLPDESDASFLALIPRHRAFIDRLIEQDIIEAYAISADRTRGWITMNGLNAAAVQTLVEQFPLFDYLLAIEVDELFIFDSKASHFPSISLN